MLIEETSSVLSAFVENYITDADGDAVLDDVSLYLAKNVMFLPACSKLNVDAISRWERASVNNSSSTLTLEAMNSVM